MKTAAGSQPTLTAKCVAEFIGTFFLMYTLSTCLTTEGIGCAFSVGATLTVMVYALGSVSGGHFNPAVTLAIWLSGRQKILGTDAVCYVLAQLAGAVAAANLNFFMMPMDGHEKLGPAAFHVPAPAAAYDKDHATGVEVIYSMALCYVVLNTATVSEKSESTNAYFGLSIGMTVTSGAIAIGPISGCSLNPALSVGSTLSAALAQGYVSVRIWGPYVLAPMIGAFLAAMSFWLVRGGVHKRHEYQEHLVPQLAAPVPVAREKSTAEEIPILNRNEPILIPHQVVGGNVVCSLRWIIESRYGKRPNCDLDLTCVKFGRHADCLGAVYFAKKEDQGIRHSGDTIFEGLEPGEHTEQIFLRLSETKPNIMCLAFVVMIYSGESFDDLARYSFRLTDGKRGEDGKYHDICRYDRKSRNDGANAQIAGLVYRQGEDWYFKAVDECYSVPANSSYRKLMMPLQAQVAEVLGTRPGPDPGHYGPSTPGRQSISMGWGGGSMV
eukprot:TRINITY_DN91646_c0_g1_i1.p1 TRINITY_DN91646_c0_g1~~TRINITY_DN91646_c0_g1_i1.p1  ORF type:complete len:495 (-),score=95.71 TRINITY_DN91646_c0_g1_i1:153-1637(-)